MAIAERPEAAKRDRVYQKLEAKINSIKEFWQASQSLPIPTPHDPEDAQEKDQAAFVPIFRTIAKRFPDSAFRYPQYLQTKARFDELSQSYFGLGEHPQQASTKSKHDQLFVQYYNTSRLIFTLEADPDLWLIHSIGAAMVNLVHKRQRIRDIYKKLGDNWKNPASYDDLLPEKLEVFKGSLRRIIPDRYSINLITARPPFLAYWKLAGADGISVNGFHHKGSVFNVCKQRVSGSTREQTLKHENLHSFMEAFPSPTKHETVLGTLSDMRDLDRTKLNIQQHIDQYVGKGDSELAFGVLGRFRQSLHQVVDAGHEEFVADLVSRPHYKVPSSTYENEIKTWKHQVLEGLIPRNDMVIWRMILQAHFRVNTYSPGGLVNTLHDIVKRQNPEKLADLDIALAIFPPSKFRHIRSLVLRRWIPKSNSFTILTHVLK